jgi:hypothetical protein
MMFALNRNFLLYMKPKGMKLRNEPIFFSENQTLKILLRWRTLGWLRTTPQNVHGNQTHMIIGTAVTTIKTSSSAPTRA